MVGDYTRRDPAITRFLANDIIGGAELEDTGRGIIVHNGESRG